jgi:hypothetical protein
MYRRNKVRTEAETTRGIIQLHQIFHAAGFAFGNRSVSEAHNNPGGEAQVALFGFETLHQC